MNDFDQFINTCIGDCVNARFPLVRDTQDDPEECAPDETDDTCESDE